MNLFPGDKPNISGVQRGACLWLFLVLAIVTLIRIRLLNMPLERDEGELAYGAQLWLQGVSPYQGAYNDALKMPGACAAYAVIMALFGQTTAALHAAVLFIILATAIFVFLLTRRICGDPAGAVAGGTYALLASNPMALGLAAHATHFVVLPAIAGLFLLQNFDARASLVRIFFAGLLLGLAFLMKQTGGVFGIFAVIWTARSEWILPEKSRRRWVARLGWLIAGELLPLTLTCGLIWRAGDSPQFWLWTFKFAFAHAAIITFVAGTEQAAVIVGQLFMAAPGLWSLALAGLILLFFAPSLRHWRFFILGFVLFSFLAAYPGWRGHYFIQLFPALGLLAGIAFHAAGPLVERLKTSFSPRAVLFPVFFMAAASPLLQWSEIYFTLTPAQACRAIYGANPFPESVEIARYLQAHCPPDARIAVLGSEPEIYFYSHRRAATGYISTYPLMEPQPFALMMQKQMISEIEKANPEYVVSVQTPSSWLRRPESPTLIFDWSREYQLRYLRLVGIVEIPPDGPAIYRWFNQNGSNSPTDIQITTASWVAIYKRR
jgi:hypothetical protein